MTLRTQFEIVLEGDAELGEGPSWDVERQELLWVDLLRGEIHRLDPARGTDVAMAVGVPVGAVVPSIDGRYLVAVPDSFGLVEWGSPNVEVVAECPDRDMGLRMNDGKCDRAGRFWAGSMGDGQHAVGTLFRLDGAHATAVVTGLTVSNGLAWSPDNTLMYFIDSATCGVDIFRYDHSDGSISARRRLVDFPSSWGTPDGMTIDETGCLWIAFWGGWAVRRFSPHGALQAVVELPIEQPTSCTFAGQDMRDLMVTSATYRLGPDQRAAQPLAGSVFRLETPCGGLPEISARIGTT